MPRTRQFRAWPLAALAIGAAFVAILTNPAPGRAATWASFHSITETSGEDAQYVDGSTVWLRAGSSGSFTVKVEAGPDGDVDFVEFPELGPGWTPFGTSRVHGAPWQLTYVWDPTTSGVLPGLVATASGTGSNADVAFDVEFDGSTPVGSTLTAQTAVTRDTTAPVSATPGTDSGAGVATWRIQRRSATYVPGGCGPWSSWALVGPVDPVGVVTDPLGAEGCYQYGVITSDRVGNTELVEQVGALRVDRTAPAGAIDAVDQRSLHAGGAIVLSGTAGDLQTGVRSASLVLEDRYAICSNMVIDAGGAWSCTWSIGHGERPGPASLRLVLADHAGNRSTLSSAIEIGPAPNPFGPRVEDIDTVPPVVGLARMPLVSWADHVVVRPTAFDDRGGFVEVRMEQQIATARSSAFGAWRPATFESEEVVLDERGETYCFRAIAIDLVGNRGVSHPRCTTLPLDDVDLRARGEWEQFEHRFAWLRTMHRSLRAGASLEARIADPTPQLAVAKCPGCGSIKVYHGTRLLGTWSLRSKKPLYRRSINLPRLIAPTRAPLRIVAASRRPVFVDALVAGR